MEEMLTWFNEEWQPMGSLPRSQVHQQELIHEVVHVWLVSREESGWWVWFQQRSFQKKGYPGLFDVAVGGHISAGEAPLPAALREMEEEIGLVLPEGALSPVGSRLDEELLHGKRNREIVRIYLARQDAPVFAPGEEVEQMVRIRAEAYLDLLQGKRTSVEAVGTDGRTLSLLSSQFCQHGREFEEKVFPFFTGLV